MLPRIRRIILALAFLPVFAAAQTSIYHLYPESTPAGAAFKLLLQGSFGCNPSFSRESVTVSDKRLDLTFVVTDRSVGPACPDTIQAATFAVPALKAGSYAVYALRTLECMYTVPRCYPPIAAPMFAGTLTVTESGRISYRIDPTSAEAGAAFDLNLLSFAFNCGTTFDHLATSVNGSQIVLTFLDHMNPAALCPAVVKEYGPTFKLPALKAGSYEVLAARLPACVDQGCKILQTLEPAGTLTVKAKVTRENKWFIDPKQTLAGKPFLLKLLNNYYDNCSVDFTQQYLNVDKGKITATFMIAPSPRACVGGLWPAGPAYDVPALASGLYPVYAQIVPYCAPGAACPLLIPAPFLVDTLVVAKTLGLEPFLASTAGFKASFADARLDLILPPGAAGSWKAELMTLGGQSIASARLTAAGGAPAHLDLATKPKRGVYLVRLESPDRIVRALPLSMTE